MIWNSQVGDLESSDATKWREKRWQLTETKNFRCQILLYSKAWGHFLESLASADEMGRISVENSAELFEVNTKKQTLQRLCVSFSVWKAFDCRLMYSSFHRSTAVREAMYKDYRSGRTAGKSWAGCRRTQPPCRSGMLERLSSDFLSGKRDSAGTGFCSALDKSVISVKRQALSNKRQTVCVISRAFELYQK